MESRATVFGHPVHQSVVSFPIGMFAFGTVCDVAHALDERRMWRRAGRAAVGAGLVGAAIAAPFGLIDFLAIPKHTRAKRIGWLHGIGNAGVTALFLASWLMRRRGADRAGVALGTAGLGLACATAWLGGELVDRYGIGVSEPTSLDGPAIADGVSYASVPSSEAVRAGETSATERAIY